MLNKRQLLFVCIIVGVVISLSCNIISLPFRDSTGETQNNNPIFDDASDNAPAEEVIKIINSVSGLVPPEGTTSVGSLDENQVVAEFESSAFEVGSQVNISSASSSDFPAPDGTRFEVSDVGYDFSLEGLNHIRPDGKVEVKFKLSSETLASLEDESFLQVAYFFDESWYLQDVESVDFENGTATLSLYHFSWLFPAKLTKEELRDQKAQEMALEKFNNENNLKRITKEGKSDLEQVISKATGVKDPKALAAIAEYMLNKKDFTSLMLSGSKGDTAGYTTKMAEMVAKTINSAAKIGSNATMIAGAFQAAGYVWEGDAQGAAEAVANAILDSTAYGKLLKLAITVTDETIKSWKKNGIEEMYQAYKNGADDGWFGYNVKKGSFEDALAQSAAIERQVKIDAVKSYLNAHGKKESDLTSAELEEIKNKAIIDLKKKFEDRVAQEAIIAKDKDYYKNLLDAFEQNDVDMMVQIDAPLMGELLSYEQRLESYTRVTDKILEMTGGRVIEFDGPADDNEIPIGVITSALRKWYEPDGDAKVRELLADGGYIEDENLIHGLEPQKVTCEGQYSYNNTRLEEPVKTCSFNMPFRVEFWNVGVLGGEEFAGATFYWNFVSFDWEGCAITSTPDKISTGQFSGGPNGSMTLGWAFIQISSGQIGTITYSDADETISGTCTINNSAAFSGWTGP